MVRLVQTWVQGCCPSFVDLVEDNYRNGCSAGAALMPDYFHIWLIVAADIATPLEAGS